MPSSHLGNNPTVVGSTVGPTLTDAASVQDYPAPIVHCDDFEHESAVGQKDHSPLAVCPAVVKQCLFDITQHGAQDAALAPADIRPTLFHNPPEPGEGFPH